MTINHVGGASPLEFEPESSPPQLLQVASRPQPGARTHIHVCVCLTGTEKQVYTV